jgi:hypothetical protein
MNFDKETTRIDAKRKFRDNLVKCNQNPPYCAELLTRKHCKDIHGVNTPLNSICETTVHEAYNKETGKET